MTKARKKVLEDIKLDRGFSNKSDMRWYWRLRYYSETTFYWINAFSWIIALIIGIITKDYWKGLAFLFLCFIYNFVQNIRGFLIHLEHLIEWIINKTV